MGIFRIQSNRLIKLFWFLIAITIRPFIKTRKNRVFFCSYNFNKYACNPRAITEYLLENTQDSYEIYWGFNKSIDTKNIDQKIHVVKKYSISYLIALYSSKFIFNNCRNNILDSLFIKKKNQKYIQTWHGAFGLKRVEKDAQDNLDKKYIIQAKIDSKMCDLMLSNSKNYSLLLRKSFWYKGLILENCMPRNDIFYDSIKVQHYYNKIRETLGFSKNSKIVLYAPTFRVDMKLNYYVINWDNVIPSFKKILGDDVKILVRLHPNMVSIKGVDMLTNYNNVFDITSYPDITEFLLSADIMISDYTSAMFDFVLQNKPCFIYAVDKNMYDRGFYMNLNQLPFPIAETENELISNINNFNNSQYRINLQQFKQTYWGVNEDGNGCRRVHEWMENVIKC